MDLFGELGVRKIINAEGTRTYLGGSVPDLRVMEAMKEASQNFVVMMELLEKAGQIIAEVTGAEAGMVTSGSTAALVLGMAACIMRDSELEKFEVQPVEKLSFDREWLDIIQKLPKISRVRSEIIIQKAHRVPYYHAFLVAGSKLVVIGTRKDCSHAELEAAINENTAAIAFTAHKENVGVPLKKVVEIASRYDIPVIVDAAAELPPRDNLRRYIAEGADLVVFSGGKKISGPNNTGILCGRRDLIKLATLQAAPYRGIGRSMKVDRTQIVGLIVALRLWLEKDEKVEFEAWRAKARWIANELKGAPSILRSDVFVEKLRSRVYAHITLDEKNGLSAADLVLNLRLGDPSIWVTYKRSNKIQINTSTLKDGEEKIVVSALKKMLSE